MEINTSLLVKKEKLVFHTTLQEAFKIPLKNPHVIIFTLLASLPFFYTQLIYETIFQRTMVAASIVLNRPYDLLVNRYDVFESGTDTFTSKTFTQGGESYCGDVLQIGLIYLVGVFIWELFSAVVTVVLASRIYRRETAMSTKEIIIEPFRKRARSNSFVTAMYVHLLSTCTLLGLIWLVANSYFVASMNSPISYFVGFLYAMAALALLKKYLEWSREWNMGIVVSILEDIHGTQALGKSAYLGKGSEDRGFLLMLVFFVWGFILRSVSLYFGWYEGGTNKRGDLYEGGGRGFIIQVGLLCVGNVMKWVVCTVYFHDCEARIIEKKFDGEAILEKKLDGEVGRDIENVINAEDQIPEEEKLTKEGQ